MGKVIVDRDRQTLLRRRQHNAGAHFHAAFDILERSQRLGGSFHRYTEMLSRRNRCQRVALVVQATEFPAHLPAYAACLQYRKVFRLALG